MKYSTALTSWTVLALDLGQLGDLVGAEVLDHLAQLGDCSSTVRLRTPGTTPCR